MAVFTVDACIPGRRMARYPSSVDGMAVRMALALASVRRPCAAYLEAVPADAEEVQVAGMEVPAWDPSGRMAVVPVESVAGDRACRRRRSRHRPLRHLHRRRLLARSDIAGSLSCQSGSRVLSNGIPYDSFPLPSSRAAGAWES